MGRSKVKLQWITNTAARRATFNKRAKGLLKKARELSTLCDVKVCLVIYKPGNVQPAGVWPSIPEAKRVLSKFHKMPAKRSKNTLNKEGFIRQQIEKMMDQLRKQEMESLGIELNLLLSDCLEERNLQRTCSITELTCVTLLIESRINQLRKWMEVVKERVVEKIMDMEVAPEELEDELPRSWMEYFQQMISGE